MLCANSAAHAQVCEGIPGLILNGGFEAPDITTTPPTPVQTFGTNPFARLYNQADVPSWQTTASRGRIEIWESGFNNVPSYEGNQHAEVNGDQVGALYQDITTTPGSTIFWRFAHRGRAGVDRVRVELGAPGGTLSNEGTFATGNTAWVVYEGVYVVPAGQSTTRFQFRAISTASSATVGNFVDGIVVAPFCDYGDAPSVYPVERVNNGAAHRISSFGFLGSAVDAELDGQPSADAQGDDTDTGPDSGDDEDGVSFGLSDSSQLGRDQANNLVLSASASGFVNVWVDYNQDGVWSAGERIFADQPVSAGAQTLSFTVPSSAALGSTFARVRYSLDDPAGAMGPGGDWDNGEVEDVRLTILDQAILLIEKSSVSFVDTGVGDGTDFRISGNDVLYTIDVTNVGPGNADLDSVLVVDSLPDELVMFNGDANGTGAGSARVLFLDNGSGLTFNPVSDVAFSNATSQPTEFSQCTFPGSPGYDPDIRFVCFNPKGVMNTGPSQPSFQLQFRAQIADQP